MQSYAPPAPKLFELLQASPPALVGETPGKKAPQQHTCQLVIKLNKTKHLSIIRGHHAQINQYRLSTVQQVLQRCA